MAASDLRFALLTGPKTAEELASALRISQATFSRHFKKSGTEEGLRSFGSGKKTIYAALRNVLGKGQDFPLFRIDEKGKVKSLGEVTSIERGAYLYSRDGKRSTTYPGIPYYLSDARPAGYLGRAFASRQNDLGFPIKITDWSEDQIFIALATRGEHLPGNLLVGEESFRRFQAIKWEKVPLKTRAKRFSELARLSIAGDAPGSSAAGEQPKFPVFLEGGVHALVKFSPATRQPKAERWADLLIAESLALETIRDEFEIPVAESEIVQSSSQVFLESKRFDRIGESGRKGCVSFSAIESEWLGKPSHWSASARALFRLKKISSEDAERIALLDAFGAWIANSDRHYGNLSFFHEIDEAQARLAPVYDMLPMFFAPNDREETVPLRKWEPPVCGADVVQVWEKAKSGAKVFWEKAEQDPRISPSFKREIKKVLKQFSE